MRAVGAPQRLARLKREVVAARHEGILERDPRSGVGVVDSGRIYCHAKVAQSLLKKSYTASLIIFKLRDPGRAPALAYLAEHGVYRRATSVFPSLTPVCIRASS